MQKKQVYSKPFNLVYEKTYPDLFMGPGTFTEVDLANDHSPNKWVNKKIDELENYRSKQIFSFRSVHKEDTRNPTKDLEGLQLLAQSLKTTELEVSLEKTKNQISEDISGINNYFYGLEDVKIIDNIRVPKIIDKVVNDFDLKARDGILKLNKRIDDVYKIEQILSAGLLGQRNKRILVPTRWSITSVDDVISKENIKEIKNYNLIDKHMVFFYEYYDNKFFILFMPRTWGFEQIENQGIMFCSDYEIDKARDRYASSVTGAYYAARLEVTNYLKKIKKQASVIVFRDIHESYSSKGVWVIREAVKAALEGTSFIFETQKEAFEFIEAMGINKGIKEWEFRSELLKEMKCQKKLFDFY